MPQPPGKPSNIIPVHTARRLLVHGLGLTRSSPSPATPARVLATIESLGFVQVDSINAVERAHHHILWTRLPQYRPEALDALQAAGRVFEHWTHDASIIPTSLFRHWRPRFADAESWAWARWLHQKLGDKREAVLNHVLERIRSEGPLMTRDFDDPDHRAGPWWDWKPAKAALEYWWRAGKLAVPRRINFHKVYDLSERVLASAHAEPSPTVDEHTDWACRSALQRLHVATPLELSRFWAAVSAAQATEWLRLAAARGEVSPVRVEDHRGESRPAFAWTDWRERARRAGKPTDAVRILNPFDPLTRDRARCQRLFGFDYRFEAFTPAAKRKYGYYVLPILQGDRLIGRLDPDLDRSRSRLKIRKVWWEPETKLTPDLRSRFEQAIAAYAAFNNAEHWTLPKRW